MLQTTRPMCSEDRERHVFIVKSCSYTRSDFNDSYDDSKCILQRYSSK